MKTKLFTSTLFLILTSFNFYSQNSISFDGTNDQVDCGNNTSVQITGTALTLEAWIYPTSWKTQFWQANIMNRESLSGGGYMLRCGAGGKLNFNIGSGPGPWNELTSATNILTLNTWQHVAGTYDGTWMRIYLNGVIVDSLAKTISIVNSTSNLGIGFAPIYAGSRNFPGKIDEVRIWNVTRTGAQIIANMNKELCVIPSSLKAYYTFNQGIAGGTNISDTTLTDLSGNSNTGILKNFNLTGLTSNWATGASLTAGIGTGSVSVNTCGSYTMPNGNVVSTSGIYYDTLMTSGGCDSIVSYSITFSSAHISNSYVDSSCVTYSMPNGSIVNASGTYYDTLSVGGCDTVDRYTITISASVDDSVYRVGARMTSWDTWADHQWVRCDSNYKPIIGATNNWYTATQVGNYAVIVKRGSCIDTSDCINFNPASISENILDFISLFPNPAESYITIQNLPKDASLKIYSIEGKIVNTLSNSATIDISKLTTGLYYLEIISDNEKRTIKFIKH